MKVPGLSSQISDSLGLAGAQEFASLMRVCVANCGPGEPRLKTTVLVYAGGPSPPRHSAGGPRGEPWVHVRVGAQQCPWWASLTLSVVVCVCEEAGVSKGPSSVALTGHTGIPPGSNPNPNPNPILSLPPAIG